MSPAAGPTVVVIGSLNMDLVCRTPRMPGRGETVIGSEFATVPGGKGANQAVAAAKLGRPGLCVHMVGRVGDDDFGGRLLTGLESHGVDAAHVTVTPGLATGCAMILVDRGGENSIVVVPGANHRLTPADVDAALPLIRAASAVVMQLEIPLEVVRHAAALCRRHKVFMILDPAPAPPDGLPPELLGVDLLTPNQIEAELLSRVVGSSERVGSELLSHGPGAVVLKRGADGATAFSGDGQIVNAPPHTVNVVDTTAAGDAFTAALAVAHAEGMPLADAVRFANAAGAACCQTFGAQPSLPSRAAVEQLMGG